MPATLYINPDGVLGPPARLWKPEDFTRWMAALSVDATSALERLLLAFPRTVVILHSHCVRVFGFKTVTLCMPGQIRARIEGSTCGGNRLVKFCRSRNYERRQWLRADLRHRAPQFPIIVDSDWAQCLPEISQWSLIVRNPRGLAEPCTAEMLFELLYEAEKARSYERRQTLEVDVDSILRR